MERIDHGKVKILTMALIACRQRGLVSQSDPRDQSVAQINRSAQGSALRGQLGRFTRRQDIERRNPSEARSDMESAG
jgi:hypothetical protein